MLHVSTGSMAVLRSQHLRLGPVRVAHGEGHLFADNLSLAPVRLHRGLAQTQNDQSDRSV